MPRCPAARRPWVLGRVMVNTAPGRSGPVRRGDRAAHGFDEAARNRQPQSGAGANLILLVGAMELVEDAIDLLRGNAAALIDDLELDGLRSCQLWMQIVVSAVHIWRHCRGD